MFFQLVITRRSNGFPPLLFATGPSDSACNNFCWHSCLSWNCLGQNDGAMIRNSHYESAGTSIKPHLHAFSPWRPWSVVSGSESPISGQDTNKDVEITWVPPPWHIPSSAYPRHQVKAKNERLHPHLRRWRSELLNWGNWNSLFNAILFFERLTCSKQYPHGSVWKLGTQKKRHDISYLLQFPLENKDNPVSFETTSHHGDSTTNSLSPFRRQFLGMYYIRILYMYPLFMYNKYTDIQNALWILYVCCIYTIIYLYYAHTIHILHVYTICINCTYKLCSYHTVGIFNLYTYVYRYIYIHTYTMRILAQTHMLSVTWGWGFPTEEPQFGDP